MKVIRQEISLGFSLEIDTPTGHHVLAATVPGSIHTDLIAAGIIGDIRTTGSEAEQEWIRNANSTYRATIPPTSAGNHELHFAGLDTLATVSINNQVKLETENMHRSYSIDVDATKEIDLQIDFKAPLPEALKRQSEQGVYPNPYNMPYNYFRKMACSFGWDWGPITGTSGIWKPITLTSWDEGILDSTTVIGDVIDSMPTLKVVTFGRGLASKILVQISGNHEAEFETILNSTNVFELPNFDLWHPRGFGSPTLYTVNVELISDSGEVVDSCTKRVGFRSVSLDQRAFDNRQMFAILVNGKRVWAKGVNWIPDDPFPHRVTREDYAKKIEDLYSVEVNAIRIWGGGIYESEDFYDLCDEKGIILIFDEIQAGLGRTGRLWAGEHWNTVPDILCLAKGIAGGVPMGATLVKPGILASMSKGEHSSTFGGNPLSCAAGTATIQALTQDKLVENSANMGKLFRQGLDKLKEKHPVIREVRGKGLMIGIELKFEVRDILMEGIEKGLLLLYSGRNILRLLPPLVITEGDVTKSLEILDELFTNEEKRKNVQG